MTAVFPIVPSYNLSHEIKFSNFTVQMGDGHEQRINKNLNWTTNRGDGLGGAGTTPSKGVNKFKLTFRKLAHVSGDANAAANKLWSFYVARCGGYEPFYFYNPTENDIDVSGSETNGRYLVRFEDNTLTRELFRFCLYTAGLGLVEVRS
jgi:phage-related protein